MKPTLLKQAIGLLQLCEPKTQPYYGCFSGGKDSSVIKHLAATANVNVIWHHNVTTIDPPETIKFIKTQHPDVIFDRPPHNFFTTALERGFPTRKSRWCCETYKESRPPMGSKLIVGIRATESKRRANRWKMVNWHSKIHGFVICPIINWTEKDVWQYIKKNKLPFNPLYNQGFIRTGCIGCPMQGKKYRAMQFKRWPGFERKWKELFRNIWKKRTGSTQRDGRAWFGDRYFSSWEEMWNWWMQDKNLPDEKCTGLVGMLS